MGIIVTTNWSGTRRSIKSFDQTFDAVYVVTGTSDSDTAINAAISHNAPFFGGANVTAGLRWSEQTGPQSFKVYAHFSFGDHGLAASSPLNELPRIRWEPLRELAPNDIDVDGNAI